MKNYLLGMLCLLLCALSPLAKAQENTAKISGRIFDPNSLLPLADAEVELLNFSPPKFTTTDADGNFELTDVPYGRHRLYVSKKGYESVTIPDVLLNAGRNFFIKVSLNTSAEIVTDKPINDNDRKKPIKVQTTKDEPYNEMSLLSAHPFTLNEVERYSGAREDPQRLAAAFAGVRFFDVGVNELLTRGYSSVGARYLINGLPIENISHLTTQKSTGGFFPMLNQNLLSDSDFMKGGFSAEYGNALSSMFDLKLREGNINRFEITGQIALNTSELTAEGPLNREKGYSFIVSYRQSILPLLARIGANYLTDKAPNYQDAHIKFDFPGTKGGDFSIFAIAGRNNLFVPYTNNQGVRNLSIDFKGINALLGLAHKVKLSKQAYLKTSLGVNYYSNSIYQDSLAIVASDSLLFDYENGDIRNLNFSLNSYANFRLSRKNTLRAGGLATLYRLDNSTINFNRGYTNIYYVGSAFYGQAFVQLLSRFSNHFRANIGLQANYFDLSKKVGISPRVALRYDISPNHSVSLGYALCQSMLPFFIYLQEIKQSDGTLRRSNQQLNFEKSHQITLSYNWKISENWRFKVEGYYHYLTNIPIAKDSNDLYILNNDIGFAGNALVPALQSAGLGKHWGVEATVEKYFSKRYYGMFSGTIFDTKYQASNGQWYNGRYNSRFIATMLLGKEFLVGAVRDNVITVDGRVTFAGGYYYTPINLAASDAFGSRIYDDSRYMGLRVPNNLRFDLKVGFRLNGKKMTHIFFIDAMNLLYNPNSNLTSGYILQDYDAIQKETYMRKTNMGRSIFFTYRVRLGFGEK